MKTKRFEALVKAAAIDGGAEGEFSAVVAVFDNVDKVGDRVKAQAFDRTLKAWRDSGKPIPVVFAHQWDNPDMHIGYADPNDVKAVPGRGLVVEKAMLDVEDNPVAKQVYRLMKRGTLTEFSFGYNVAQGGEKKASDGAYDLTDLNLFEFGPCLKGVNPETELLEVKAAVEERAGAEFKSVDVQLSGSYEETQDELCEALCTAYAADYGYVELIGVFSDHVVYRVVQMDEDTTYIAGYTVDGDEYTVDTENAREAELTATAAPAESNEEAKAVTVTGAFRARRPNIVKPLRPHPADYSGSGVASEGDVYKAEHIVGEQGPEVFVPSTSGRIVPVADLEGKKDYSQAERDAMAKDGEALPDGSFPIKSVEDLKNAIQAIGRASDPAKAKAHIKARARALGQEGLIPEDWGKADAPEHEDDDTSDVLAKTDLFLAMERLKHYEDFAGLNDPGYLDAAHEAARLQDELDGTPSA